MFCTEAQYARCDVEWTEKGKRFAFDHRPFRTPAIMYPLITIFGQRVSADQFPGWNVSFVESLFPSACFGLTNDMSNIRTERNTISISLVIRIFSLFVLSLALFLSVFVSSPLLFGTIVEVEYFYSPSFLSLFLLFSSPSSNKFRWNQPLQWSKFRLKKCDKFVEEIKISSIQSDRHSFLERPRLELTGASHGRNHEFWKRLSFYPLNPR